MSEETIFETPDMTISEGSIQVGSPQTLSIPTEALDYVGNGKKYHSVEDALKSIPHAQSHIQTLEEEMAKMREELTRRQTAAELLEELKASPTTTTQQIQQTSPEDIVKTVEAILSAKEEQGKVKANVGSVIKTFTDAFGDKAQEQYVKLAQDTGLTVEQLNKLAASSPSAVIKLAGINSTQQVAPGKLSGSSINTEGLKPSSPNVSAKVPKGATTKDLVNAWRNAGELAKQSF